MVNKRILVTGGAGFIGSHIVDLLAAENCRNIVIVDNFVRGSPDNLAAALRCQNVTLVKGDVRDAALMRELVGASDIVFHQAALRITHCAEEPRTALETMVDGTFELAQLCADSGVEKIIYASSASIYGMADSFPISERHHSNSDRTFYGVAKLFGEGVLRALGVPHTALRYFNVYGPRMDIHGRYTEVLVRWMERIDAGAPPIIFGDGKQTMDFVDVRDVARANLLAAKSEISGQAFNIASGIETSLFQLATYLAVAMERPQLVPVMQASRGATAVERRLGDGEKARKMLGFTPEITLQQGLLDLVAWWRGKSKSKAGT
ncbi:MAG: NAD-dependent epimerase/dehydratase family protein [Pseudolabrys sp.]